MNTRAIAEEYRLAHWAQIVKERQQSGLSIKSYCESADYHENTYYYWQRKLREAACGELSRVANDETKSLQAIGFTEIKLTEPPALPSSLVEHQSRVQVDIGGILISADCEYPVNILVDLIQGLRRPC
jgi:transposase-like protein